MSLLYIVYVSYIPKRCTKEELQTMLQEFRLHNEKHNITGLLLYHDGNVIQYIEGEIENVKNLYKRIFNDTRHIQVTQLLCRHINKRHFPDWKMALKNCESEYSKKTFSNYLLQTKSSLLIDDEKVEKLFMLFRQLNIYR